MRLVNQPTGSSQCGQACVAIILETTLKDAIEMVGKKGGTRTVDLALALTGAGCRIATFLTRGKPPVIEGIYLCRVRWKGCRHRSHWVVVEYRYHADPRVYDPDDTHVRHYLGAGWISSYLKIERRAS